MQFDPFLSPCTELKSKWIKDCHIKSDTLNLTKENVEMRLKHICTVEIFLTSTPVAQDLRSSIDKWEIIKLKSFCKAKDTVRRTTWQPTDWEKIVTNPYIR